MNLRFWERSLVTRRFGLHSDSRGAVEIKDLPISIDFRNRNTELLLLFSIISPWLHRTVERFFNIFRNKLIIWFNLRCNANRLIYNLMADIYARDEIWGLMNKFWFIGNKAEGRISKRVFQENKAGQFFRKTNISYHLIRG